jgi:hypothetical protein
LSQVRSTATADHPAARYRVAADLGVPWPADEGCTVWVHAEAPAGAEGAAANEGLADHVAGDPDAVSVAEEDRLDVRIVDPVALDRNIAIPETVWKAVNSFGERDPDGDGAQGVAAPSHLVGTDDAVREMVVPEREAVGQPGFGPQL